MLFGLTIYYLFPKLNKQFIENVVKITSLCIMIALGIYLIYKFKKGIFTFNYVHHSPKKKKYLQTQKINKF